MSRARGGERERGEGEPVGPVSSWESSGWGGRGATVSAASDRQRMEHRSPRVNRGKKTCPSARDRYAPTDDPAQDRIAREVVWIALRAVRCLAGSEGGGDPGAPGPERRGQDDLDPMRRGPRGSELRIDLDLRRGGR